MERFKNTYNIRVHIWTVIIICPHITHSGIVAISNIIRLDISSSSLDFTAFDNLNLSIRANPSIYKTPGQSGEPE